MTRKYKPLILDLDTNPKRELDLLENLEKTDLEFKFEEGKDMDHLLIDPYSFKRLNISEILHIISKSLKINCNKLSFYYRAVTVNMKNGDISDSGKRYLTTNELIEYGGSSIYIKYEKGQFYFITTRKIYSDAPTWFDKFKIIEITPDAYKNIRDEIFRIIVETRIGDEISILSDLMHGFFRDNPKLECYLFDQFRYTGVTKYETNN